MGAMVERTANHRAGGVVHDQRDAQVLTDCSHFRDGKSLELGIRQGLGVIGLGLVIRGAPEVLGIRRIDEPHLNACRLQRIGKEIPGSAVQVRGTDHVVPGLGDVLNRKGRRGLAGREGQCPDATVHGRHALFQDIAGRIHDTRVDVAQFLQGKQVLGMLSVVELIGRGLIDRHGHRTGHRIRTIAGVENHGLRIGIDWQVVVRHGRNLLGKTIGMGKKNACGDRVEPASNQRTARGTPGL